MAADYGEYIMIAAIIAAVAILVGSRIFIAFRK